MLDISLAMASVVTTLNGVPFTPTQTVSNTDGLGVTASYDLVGGVEYVLRIAVVTTRPPMASTDPPVAEALSTAESAILESLETAHSKWWYVVFVQ